MARWVGVQRQETWTKNTQKHPHLRRQRQSIPNTDWKFVFFNRSSKTCRIHK